MEPQDLDIGGLELFALDGAGNLGEGRNIAAEENIFANPGIGPSWPPAAANGVEKGDTVGGEPVARLGEETAVVVDADVLEHPHRYDPIVGAGLVAVVAQGEPDPAGETFALGTDLGISQLLGRKGEPGHLDVVLAGEVKRKSAPTGADVENLRARLEQELGGDVAFFIELGGVQVFRSGAEIGATVLPVGIEKKII